MMTIAAADYHAALGSLRHLFLVGDLQRPTPHPFVRDPRLDFILCTYAAGDDGELHWHRDVTEYELVTAGRVGHLHVATGETHWYGAGDFSIVPPGACVRRLVPEPSQTVAVKVPSRPDDKVGCARCPRLCRWRVTAFEGTRP
jgi:hypothetical protein